MGDKIAVMDAGRLVQYASPPRSWRGQRAFVKPWSAPAKTVQAAFARPGTRRGGKGAAEGEAIPTAHASAMRWLNFCGQAARHCR